MTDGNNDVAWLVISDKNTLGVTWFTTSGAPEADMALNTAFRWTVDPTAAGREGGCKGPSRKCYVFDAQTVFVHENGHVAGLGHSSVEGAVMEPAYEEVRRVLHQDDINGLTALYSSDTAATGGTASVASVTHSKSGGRSGDKHLSVAVAVDDGDAKPVSGASVSVLLDLLDSPRAWSGTGTTGGDGTVTFTLSNAPSGCYTTTVTDVSADGLTWDNSDGQPNGFCK